MFKLEILKISFFRRLAIVNNIVFMAIIAFPMAGHAQMTPDQASARCQQVYAKYENMRNIASNVTDQAFIKQCMDLGIDPPLKARRDWGIRPAASVPLSRIPSTICPPSESCLSAVRRMQGGVEITKYQDKNKGTGADTDFPENDLNAPEFQGMPKPKPDHLKGGGTVYFYDPVNVTPPCDSLIYSDSINNEYADCNPKGMGGDSYVASPPPNPPGNIMSMTPIVLNQDALMNFVDGGVIVLPEGFVGIINGQPVQGGDTIIIKHAGDMRLPAGTKLYPFPDGYLAEKGTHYTWDGWEPYNGPDLILPQNAMVIEAQNQSCPTRCDEPVPGTNWF